MHQRPLTQRSTAGIPDLAASATGADRWATAALLAVALAGLAIPVWLVAIPPLLDYPNHLVRLWLIAGGADIPPLSKMYAVSWTSAYTNVGIDYLGAVLGRLVPAVQLGSILVLLALVLPPLGAAALNRAMFCGVHWWQIAFVFFAWNATLIAGFLNFHIGIGAALLAVALDLCSLAGGRCARPCGGTPSSRTCSGQQASSRCACCRRGTRSRSQRTGCGLRSPSSTPARRRSISAPGGIAMTTCC